MWAHHKIITRIYMNIRKTHAVYILLLFYIYYYCKNAFIKILDKYRKIFALTHIFKKK